MEGLHRLGDAQEGPRQATWVTHVVGRFRSRPLLCGFSFRHATGRNLRTSYVRPSKDSVVSIASVVGCSLRSFGTRESV